MFFRVITPFKPMTEEEAQGLKAEKAADRAFKIEEMKSQAKKAGIPENYMEMIENKPYNCEKYMHDVH